jgi:hypothetical protein
MPSPLQVLQFVHCPMRRDLAQMAALSHHIDTEASSGTLQDEALASLRQRYDLWRSVLQIHEEAEDLYLFSAIETATSGATEQYQEADRQIDQRWESLSQCFDERDLHRLHMLFHELEHAMGAHLDEEEQQLLPLADQHIPSLGQGTVAG